MHKQVPKRPQKYLVCFGKCISRLICHQVMLTYFHIVNELPGQRSSYKGKKILRNYKQYSRDKRHVVSYVTFMDIAWKKNVNVIGEDVPLPTLTMRSHVSCNKGRQKGKAVEKSSSDNRKVSM